MPFKVTLIQFDTCSNEDMSVYDALHTLIAPADPLYTMRVNDAALRYNAYRLVEGISEKILFLNNLKQILAEFTSSLAAKARVKHSQELYNLNEHIYKELSASYEQLLVKYRSDGKLVDGVGVAGDLHPPPGDKDSLEANRQGGDHKSKFEEIAKVKFEKVEEVKGALIASAEATRLFDQPLLSLMDRLRKLHSIRKDAYKLKAALN